MTGLFLRETPISSHYEGDDDGRPVPRSSGRGNTAFSYGGWNGKDAYCMTVYGKGRRADRGFDLLLH